MYESCLFFNLNSFTRSLNKRWEEAFAKFELSPSHGYLLRLVLLHPGSTQKWLAEQMGLAPSTVTRFLEVLEERGYVERKCCTDDARVTKVSATKQAVKIASELSETIEDLGATLRRALGDRETELLVRSLRAGQERLEKKSEKRPEKKMKW